MHHGEFRDARLALLYDRAFPWSHADDFFLAVVDQTPRARVLDLGCGTGRLALAMAAAGHIVTGVDPARASLEVARVKPRADQVTWVEGTSAVVPNAAFDVAVMTSHVAQFFVEDAEWRTTLEDLRRALVPGSLLAFDTRDPADRGWEQWNPVHSRRRVPHPAGGDVDMWVEVTNVAPGAVSFAWHYGFSDGDQRLSTATLRFRSLEEIRSSLDEAGFAVENVFGGWDRQPVGAGDGELLVLARG